MNFQETLDLVENSLNDMKAQDIKVIDVREKSSMTEFMVVATGTSTRHVKSIAGELIKNSKHAGIPPIGSEGEDNGEWVLVDLNDVIVHVMQASVRDFYNLEKLWEMEASDDAMDVKQKS